MSEIIINDLDKFIGREDNLRNITRYSLYDVMWYRTDLWIHSRRVAWIVKEISPLVKKVFGDKFDEKKAYISALVHDDAEMIIGDIQAGNKDTMTEEQIHKLDDLEKEAVKELVKRFPSNVDGYVYKILLDEAVNKNSLESMVVDWADKYDGFCEALHEIFAGHQLWTRNVVNKYGTISLPTDHYMKYFSKFEKKFPESKKLFIEVNQLFKVPEFIDIHKIVKLVKECTANSINKKTGYLPYDLWISITLKNGTEEDIANLYRKKEFDS
ncbi:MAG: YfbR-like 5'-deoxynucleotidase [Candidatus Paceibacterota bacterium]